MSLNATLSCVLTYMRKLLTGLLCGDSGGGSSSPWCQRAFPTEAPRAFFGLSLACGLFLVPVPRERTLGMTVQCNGIVAFVQAVFQTLHAGRCALRNCHQKARQGKARVSNLSACR